MDKIMHHNLTLSYGPNGFKPSRDPLPVRRKDTISFHLADDIEPGSAFHVKMNNPEFFSVGEASDSQTQVEVLRAASATYECKLFDAAGKLVGESGGNDKKHGGGIEPDPGRSDPPAG